MIATKWGHLILLLRTSILDKWETQGSNLALRKQWVQPLSLGRIETCLWRISLLHRDFLFLYLANPLEQDLLMLASKIWGIQQSLNESNKCQISIVLVSEIQTTNFIRLSKGCLRNTVSRWALSCSLTICIVSTPSSKSPRGSCWLLTNHSIA